MSTNGTEKIIKRKRTPGRPLKGAAYRKGTYFTLSFKYEDRPIYQQVMRIAEEENVPVSEIVVDALRLKFSGRDLGLIKESILQLYADKKIVGPDFFKVFEDVFEWELQNTTHAEIPLKWNITIQSFACLMYLYSMSQREAIRMYNKNL